MEEIRNSLSQTILASCRFTFPSFQALRYDALLGVTVDDKTCVMFQFHADVGMLTDIDNAWIPSNVDKEKFKSGMVTELISLFWRNLQNIEKLNLEGMITVIIDQTHIVFLNLDHQSTKQLPPNLLTSDVDINSLQTSREKCHHPNINNEAADVSLMDEEIADSSIYHLPDPDIEDSLQNNVRPQDEDIILMQAMNSEICRNNTMSEESCSLTNTRRHPPYKRIDGKQVCPICEKLLSKNMAQHIRGHRGIKPHICRECGAKFTHRTALNRHHSRIHLQLTFDCNMCGKMHRTQSLLDDHMNHHLGETPYKCDICCSKFSSKKSLDCHTEQLHIKKLRCKYCSTPFTTEDKRKQHEKAHEIGLIDKKFQCLAKVVATSKKRRKEWNTKNYQQRKGRVKKKTQDFVCDVCSVTFTSAAELMRHLKEHQQHDVT